MEAGEEEEEGNGISEPTSALPTGHQAEYVIMRRLPCMMYVVREKIHLRGYSRRTRVDR